MKNKAKKKIVFYNQYGGLMKEHTKRLERKYQKHRNRSTRNNEKG